MRTWDPGTRWPDARDAPTSSGPLSTATDRHMREGSVQRGERTGAGRPREPGCCGAESPSAEGERPAFHSHRTGLPRRAPLRSSSQPGPLTFFKQSVSLLSSLAGPDLPRSAGQPCPLFLVLLYRRGDGHGSGEGREPSAALVLGQAGMPGHKLTARVREKTPLPHVETDV